MARATVLSLLFWSVAFAARRSTSPSCGQGLLICEVIDPTRSEAPWHDSTKAWPQCYDPIHYTCSSNFLCPIDAPKIHGQYRCGAAQASSSSSQGISVDINAPGTGDIDGIKGYNFIIDITLQALSPAYDDDIPVKPLYQDSNSSTFGPGPNAAFPGLVVLQNTTVDKAPFVGPNTNLAGLFQLNGVAKIGNNNQYNTIWDAGAPAFGIGPSEVIVYYVSGQASKEMPTAPRASDGLISNVASVAFTISNRSDITASSLKRMCENGASYMPPSKANDMSKISAQIFHPRSGNIVGVNGSGWILDLVFNANSAVANAKIDSEDGYTSGFVNQSSPAFKPGPDSLLPGLVVLMNTTVDMAPFKGPGTNLAGLFQSNNLRTVDCNTLIEIWAGWLVGKPIVGHGPSKIYAFLVHGTAPAYIADMTDLASRTDLISTIASVDIVVS